MNPIDLSKAKDPDIRNSWPALLRAAELARKTAMATNTAIVVVRDGELVHISADELRRENQQTSA